MQIDFRVGLSRHDIPPVSSVRFTRSTKVGPLSVSRLIVLFKYSGYDFARHPTCGPLREQIMRPDESILTGNTESRRNGTGCLYHVCRAI